MIVRRPGSHARRRRGSVHRRPAPAVQRSSARVRFSPRRALAALVMVSSAAAVYGVAASPAFALRTIHSEGAALTGDATVRAALGYGPDALAADGTVANGPNLFRLATAPLADRVRALPAIAGAEVVAALPDGVDVRVTERDPILAWADGDRRILVDRDGLALVDAAAMGATDAARAAVGGLPLVTDRRASASHLVLGGTIDPVDFDAATRLLSLTPKEVGSAARTLEVGVDDRDGWTLTADTGWVAVFGFYTPTLRSPELIPGQVRLLRSLLVGREQSIRRVILADDHAGTYVER